ncbi:MAG: hypothetical protein KGI60_00140 [Patescibacteria group bacterium]|nr:hypothetical protein [Patescibacteria group bacterium]
MRHSSRCGQMMIEAMVALSIVLVGLLGIFSLVSRSLSLNRVATEQYTGANLAAEGIEIVKNILDANALQKNAWNMGVAPGEYQVDYTSASLAQYGGVPLHYDPATGMYSYAGPETTSYNRKITVSQPSPDEIVVDSTVSWTTRDSGQFQVDLEDHFFNWR